METVLTVFFMIMASVVLILTLNVFLKTFFNKTLLGLNDAYVMDVVKYSLILFLIMVLVYYGLF